LGGTLKEVARLALLADIVSRVYVAFVNSGLGLLARVVGEVESSLALHANGRRGVLDAFVDTVGVIVTKVSRSVKEGCGSTSLALVCGFVVGGARL